MQENTTANATPISIGQQYMEQVETWKKQVEEMRGNPSSARGAYHCFIHVELQSLAAEQGRLDLIPLIDAGYSARPELQPIKMGPIPIGRPLSTRPVRIEGALFGSDLLVVDEQHNIGQSMVRLVMVNAKDGTLNVLDIWSDPAMDVMKGEPSSTHRLNWNACLPSRAERIVTTCRDNGCVVLGWMQIQEINDRRMPTY